MITHVQLIIYPQLFVSFASNFQSLVFCSDVRETVLSAPQTIICSGKLLGTSFQEVFWIGARKGFGFHIGIDRLAICY